MAKHDRRKTSGQPPSSRRVHDMKVRVLPYGGY